MAAIVCAAQGGDVFGPQPGEAKPQPRLLPSGLSAGAGHGLWKVEVTGATGSLPARVSSGNTHWRTSRQWHPEHHATLPCPTQAAATQERWARARQLLDDHAARRISSDAQRRCLTGLAPLDEALGGGMPLGTLCEMVAANEGLGVTDLALRVAWAATGHTRMLFLIDPPGHLYPPTFVRRGVGLQRLVILRGLRRTDAIWAMEQILRCGAVGAVLGLFGVPDVRSARRLQLAAEAGGRLGLLVHGDTEGIPAQFAALRMIFSAKRQSGNEATRQPGNQPGRARLLPSQGGEAPCQPREGQVPTNVGWPAEPSSLSPQHSALSTTFSRRLHVRLLKTRTQTALDSFLLELGDAAGDVRVHAVPGDGRADVQHRAIG
jgi:hypothetical protein